MFETEIKWNKVEQRGKQIFFIKGLSGEGASETLINVNVPQAGNVPQGGHVPQDGYIEGYFIHKTPDYDWQEWQ